MNQSQNVHEEIVQSIEEGDYGQAKEMLRAHIRGFISLMEDIIGDKI
jgi:DNA-binding GntR family transcriptional regulator